MKLIPMKWTHFLFIPLVILLLVQGNFAAQTEAWPPPTNFISDFAGIIPDRDENAMNSMARLLQQSTTAEIAVVTIDTYKSRGFGSIEEAAVNLFEQWQIGQQEKDNGLLVLVAIQDRQWRIEVGYGLEGVITDLEANQFGQNILRPAFRQQEYGRGLMGLTTALAAQIAEENNVPLSQVQIDPNSVPQQQARGRNNNSSPGGFISFIIPILMFFFFMRNPKLFLLFWLLGGMNQNRRHWDGGSHFGGGMGGGGSSFGGGFGGFGGGSSGGGGASGSW